MAFAHPCIYRHILQTPSFCNRTLTLKNKKKSWLDTAYFVQIPQFIPHAICFTMSPFS